KTFNDNLNSIVFPSSFLCLIAGNRFIRSITQSVDTGSINPKFIYKIFPYTISAALRQHHVDAFFTGIIGMTDYFNAGFRMRLHEIGKFLDVFIMFFIEKALTFYKLRPEDERNFFLFLF